MPARFSRPESARFAQQAQGSIFAYAGNTATWRQFVSASAGIPAAGIGSAVYYREQTITAVFGRGILGQFPEMQVAAGMQAAGVVMMTSPHKLGRQDEILWRGVTFRVEADPVPAKMLSNWQVALKRGDG